MDKSLVKASSSRAKCKPQGIDMNQMQKQSRANHLYLLKERYNNEKNLEQNVSNDQQTTNLSLMD